MLAEAVLLMFFKFAENILKLQMSFVKSFMYIIYPHNSLDC